MNYARPGMPLSQREARVLWYAGQGYTYERASRELGVTIHTVKARVNSAFVKLEAVSIAQAVFIAMTRGIIGTYIDCGDRAAYLRHLRRREPTCMACRRGNADDAMAKRAQHR